MIRCLMCGRSKLVSVPGLLGCTANRGAQHLWAYVPDTLPQSLPWETRNILRNYSKHDAAITFRIWHAQRNLERARRQRLLVEVAAFMLLIAVAVGTFWLMVSR